MNIEPIFSSFLVTGEFDNVDNQKIFEWCKKQDQINATHLKFDEPELQEYFVELKEIFNDLHKKLGFVFSHQQKLARGWLNMNPNDS